MHSGPLSQPEIAALKTTVLFALFVAFLANPPTVREPGQGGPAPIVPSEQQPAATEPVQSPKREETATKNNSARSDGKKQESARKD